MVAWGDARQRSRGPRSTVSGMQQQGRLSMARTPTIQARITASLAIAVIVALFSVFKGIQDAPAPDFAMFWVSARALVAGQNPYAIPRVVGEFTFESGFLNPLPAAVVVTPVAGMPFLLATAVFNAVGMGLLAFALSRKDWQRMPILMSFPALYSLVLGQWSPYVTAAAVSPWLAWAAVCKPNIGLTAFARSPSWRFVWVAAATLAFSFVVRPAWLGEWLSSLQTVPPGTKVAPVAIPGGLLLLAALIRWRRPDARLLVAMSCVPHTMMFCDELILGLLAETRKQALIFSIWSYGAIAAAALIVTPQAGDAAYYRLLSHVVVWGYYLPALVVVIRRPNEGHVMPFVERMAARWPAWLRGQQPSTHVVP